MTCRFLALTLLCLAFASATHAQTFEQDIKPFVDNYCFDCHSGDDPSGDIDFASYESTKSATLDFETWGKASELLSQKKMPPEDAPQPTNDDLAVFQRWYKQAFVEVEARPGTFRPRRLSATEYRNTVRSLFGFDLEVAVMEAEQTTTEKSLVLKLLPTDPPGKSRFRNDTRSNPLSAQIWEQYSYLTDFALEELFSPERRDVLESIVGDIKEDTGFQHWHAESLVRNFLPRALRRGIDEEELENITDRLDPYDIENTTKRELKAVLMSPPFLYRGFLMPSKPGEQQRVDNYELAERLSYFLWADMPDAELLRLAKAGSLSDDDKLRTQVERMLDSPKARTLATDFATQWLLLDEIDHVSDNPPMMVALKSQPIDFFNYLIEENRPLMELVDSETAFASPLTRKFYQPDTKQLGKYRKPKGIEIEIVANQRLTLEHTRGRGGLLTMPGVLAMNRGPILRGVWMLERIMGEHLPDPPADVGQVEANIPGEHLSFRERFAQHREDASCAICHDKIDPLGFALEAYDDNGRYLFANFEQRKSKNELREKSDESGIETHGRLPSGEEFADFDELKQILITKRREPIVRNIVQQTLAYALCRKLEIYDRPTVETIVGKMLETNGTWRELVHAIVNSLPFRETYVPEAEPTAPEANTKGNHELEN